jgi:hypothetical protein
VKILIFFYYNQYSGNWFERERYQQRDEPEADCLRSQYVWNFINNTFAITREGYDIANDEVFNRNASGVLAFPDVPRQQREGLLNITYYGDMQADEANYFILASDYYSFAVGWGCQDIDDNQSREFAWVLTRQAELNPEIPDDADTLARIETYIDRHLDRNLFRWTLQSDEECFNRENAEGRRLRKQFSKKKN